MKYKKADKVIVENRGHTLNGIICKLPCDDMPIVYGVHIPNYNEHPVVLDFNYISFNDGLSVYKIFLIGYEYIKYDPQWYRELRLKKLLG